MSEMIGNMDSSTSSNLHLATPIPLPDPKWEVLWDEIIVEEKWRRRLKNYIPLLTNGKLLSNGMSRLISFQGPPGTGKTSLAKGYANYVSQQIKGPTWCMWVNASQWRSKWLGEPAKLVEQMFRALRMTMRRGFVILLIDELESIAISRARTVSTAEPSDVITAVSELLNQIDQLHDASNILVITTTNLNAAIDEAFLSRADFIIPFGLPNEASRKVILRRSFEKYQSVMSVNGDLINRLSEITGGMSGRDLAKLPMRILIDTSNKHSVGIADFELAMDELRAEHNHTGA